ncbi:hypothetical protein [Paenibacillus sp. NFR01]|uniref:hypothetical protein n=1 Tax=Paenibacillus sp. NFR01 TaxID=1566279 RepID=UPI0008CC2154|nr:hypothetical protein [Paenibacillus sp. NFR01]SEU32975.1 hypothetical protein SAMN03159358_0174 [Paenibacillus sp. NFR01]
MKKIWTDFNGPNLNKLRLTKDDLSYFNLQPDERIILYTEDIEVEAVVEYDEEQESWCGSFVSEVITVNKEIEEAREDGFINGKYFGKWSERNEIIHRMVDRGIPRETIIEVTKVTDEHLRRGWHY